MTFLLASLKTHTNSKKFSESLLSLVNFFQCTFIASFRNNFQDHSRDTEQFLETKGGYQKAGTSSLKGVTGVISQLVSDFIEASRNIIFDFLYKKATKNYENHKRSFKKYSFEF
jgi:hypothetical protein